MRKLFIVLALLPALPAHAVGFDHKVPVSFCEPGERVADRIQNCETNTEFRLASSACLEKLNQLERKLGDEAMAIAKAGVETQVGEMHTGDAEYQFSAAAMDHLIAVARLARSELDPYYKYVAPPDVFDGSVDDPFAAADRTNCFGGTNFHIQSMQNEFSGKIARFQQRLAESKKHSKTLKGSVAATNTLGSQKAARTTASGGGKIQPSAPAARDSDISGIKEDEAARKLVP